MTEISRRSFLRGTLAATLVASLPAISAAQSLPILYGDGVHDDWDAIHALFRGEPIIVEGERIAACEGRLAGGQFLINKGLEFRGLKNWIIENCTFYIGPEFPARGVFIDGGGCEDVHVKDCTFDGIRRRPGQDCDWSIFRCSAREPGVWP